MEASPSPIVAVPMSTHSRLRLVVTVVALGQLGCHTPVEPAVSTPKPRPEAPADLRAAEPAPSPPPSPSPLPPERTLWQADVDLDGDGILEPVRLSSRDVSSHTGSSNVDERVDIPIIECVSDRDNLAPCRASLTAGDHSVEVVLNSGYFGGLGVRVVDIDSDSPGHELLLTSRGSADEDPPYLFSVAYIRAGELVLVPLWNSFGYNSGTVDFDGQQLRRVPRRLHPTLHAGRR